MSKEDIERELKCEKDIFKELTIKQYQLKRMMIDSVVRMQKLEEELYGEVRTKWEDVDI